MQRRGPVASVTGGYYRCLTHHDSDGREITLGLMLLDPRYARFFRNNRLDQAFVHDTPARDKIVS